MNRQSYNLTITIPVEVWCEKGGQDVCLDNAKAYLERDKYEDGRYPFCDEMFAHGLSLMLKGAIYNSMVKFFSNQYGENTTVKDGNSEYNKAHLEAGKWMDDDFRSVSIEPANLKVTITKANAD